MSLSVTVGLFQGSPDAWYPSLVYGVVSYGLVREFTAEWHKLVDLPFRTCTVTLLLLALDGLHVYCPESDGRAFWMSRNEVVVSPFSASIGDAPFSFPISKGEQSFINSCTDSTKARIVYDRFIIDG
uniref:Uncharacterized protein n=1 Tax=Anopheles farauti TaxID=69004 RepID=A0A182QH08_9DIPT